MTTAACTHGARVVTRARKTTPDFPKPKFISWNASALGGLSQLLLSRYSRKLSQYVRYCSWVSAEAPPVACRAADATMAVHPFGLQTTLNLGAGGDFPMRHNSISRPKKCT